MCPECVHPVPTIFCLLPRLKIFEYCPQIIKLRDKGSFPENFAGCSWISEVAAGQAASQAFLKLYSVVPSETVLGCYQVNGYRLAVKQSAGRE